MRRKYNLSAVKGHLLKNVVVQYHSFAAMGVVLQKTPDTLGHVRGIQLRFNLHGNRRSILRNRIKSTSSFSRVRQ